MAKQEVEVKKNNALPAHLQGGKKHKIGNVDSTDLIIPRIKLLQSVSPEIEAFNDAKQGNFWHTIASQMVGTELRGIPVIMRKSYVLWAPRGDDRNILARANDGLNWDNAGMEFEVKPKNSPVTVKYKLGKTVHDKVDGFPALSEFGSSIPADSNSPPAAALTYQFLWWFPELEGLSPAVIINTRSSVKPAKDLLSKIDLRPCEHYGQAYKITVKKDGTPAEPFFNYVYTADGYATEDEYGIAESLYNKFNTAEWRANDESEEEDKTGSTGGGSGAGHKQGTKSDSDKF